MTSEHSPLQLEDDVLVARQKIALLMKLARAESVVRNRDDSPYAGDAAREVEDSLQVVMKTLSMLHAGYWGLWKEHLEHLGVVRGGVK